MEEKLKSAVESLAGKAATAEKAIDAQQFAQAALNAAHALATIWLNKPKS